jgi:hypothetical protein
MFDNGSQSATATWKEDLDFRRAGRSSADSQERSMLYARVEFHGFQNRFVTLEAMYRISGP